MNEFKNEGTKSSSRPGVNFTNILRAAFLYKSTLRSFSLLTVCWLCNFLSKEYWRKRWSLVTLTTDIKTVKSKNMNCKGKSGWWKHCFYIYKKGQGLTITLIWPLHLVSPIIRETFTEFVILGWTKRWLFLCLFLPLMKQAVFFRQLGQLFKLAWAKKRTTITMFSFFQSLIRNVTIFPKLRSLKLTLLRFLSLFRIPESSLKFLRMNMKVNVLSQHELVKSPSFINDSAFSIISHLHFLLPLTSLPLMTKKLPIFSFNYTFYNSNIQH